MSAYLLRLLLTCIISAALISCSFPVIKQTLSKPQLNLVNGRIIDEATRHKFDVVNTDIKNLRFFLDAKINNVSESMMLDSGSTFSLLDSNKMSQFSLKTGFFLPDEWVRLAWNDLTNLESKVAADVSIVGKTEIKSMDFRVGRKIHHSILGIDFLSNASAIFICNPGILLLPSRQTPLDLKAMLQEMGYVEVPLVATQSVAPGEMWEKGRTNVLYAPVSVEGHRGLLLVDTGAYVTYLAKDKVKKPGWSVLAGALLSLDAVGTYKWLDLVQLESFVIGGVDLGTLYTGYLPMPENDYIEMEAQNCVESASTNLQVIGVLGGDMLRRLCAVIDFANGKLYVHG